MCGWGSGVSVPCGEGPGFWSAGQYIYKSLYYEALESDFNQTLTLGFRLVMIYRIPSYLQYSVFSLLI